MKTRYGYITRLGEFEKSGLSFDAITQRENCFDRLHRGRAVVLLFGLGKIGVRDQARMRFGGVVAARAVRPTVAQSLRRPVIVSAFGEPLGERGQVRRQSGFRGINRSG